MPCSIDFVSEMVVGSLVSQHGARSNNFFHLFDDQFDIHLYLL